MSISISMLPNLFSIYRYDLLSDTPDDLGGFSRAAVLVQSGIPCNLQYTTGLEKTLYGKNNIPAEYRLYCNTGLDGVNYIETTDLIYVEIDGDGGKFYDICYIDNSVKIYDHLRIFIKHTEAPQIYVPDSSSSLSSDSSDSSSSYSTSSSSSSIDSSSSSSSSFEALYHFDGPITYQNFEPDGNYNGRMSYTNLDNSYYMWFDNGTFLYKISVVKGGAPTYVKGVIGLTPDGTYNGIYTVSLI